MCQGFSHFSGFLPHFVVAKLVTRSLRVKKFDIKQWVNYLTLPALACSNLRPDSLSQRLTHQLVSCQPLISITHNKCNSKLDSICPTNILPFTGLMHGLRMNLGFCEVQQPTRIIHLMGENVKSAVGEKQCSLLYHTCSIGLSVKTVKGCISFRFSSLL